MNEDRRDVLNDEAWPEPSQFKKSIRLEFTMYVSAIIVVLMLVTGYVISSQYVKTVTVNVVDKLLVQARSYSSPAGKLIISAGGPDAQGTGRPTRRVRPGAGRGRAPGRGPRR